jgi:alpha/beta superfamily hydrolase
VVSALVVPQNPETTMALAKLSFGGVVAAVAVAAKPSQTDIPSGTNPSRPRKETFIRKLRIRLQNS